MHVPLLNQVTPALPTQWEGKTETGEELYIRYRHGLFRVDLDDTTIFEVKWGGQLDGVMTDKEMLSLLPPGITIGAITHDYSF